MDKCQASQWADICVELWHVSIFNITVNVNSKHMV